MRKSLTIPEVIFLIAKNLEKAPSQLQIYFHSRRKLNYTRVGHLALQLTGHLQLSAVAYGQLFKFAALKTRTQIYTTVPPWQATDYSVYLLKEPYSLLSLLDLSTSRRPTRPQNIPTHIKLTQGPSAILFSLKLLRLWGLETPSQFSAFFGPRSPCASMGVLRCNSLAFV
jgi:hypothetical protein